MSKKAENRRTAKGFKPGDRVTWGNGSVVYSVERVVADGVKVREPDGRELHVRFKWTRYRVDYELRHGPFGCRGAGPPLPPHDPIPGSRADGTR